jgi:23S rRNA (guanosine2251-2'-O)-methyltransferase
MARNDSKIAHWVWGRHSVQAVLGQQQRKILKAVCLAGKEDGFRAAKVKVEVVGSSTFQHLFGDVPHQGVAVQVDSIFQVDLHDLEEGVEQRPILALDQLLDPHNVGALWRSAAAFGFQAVMVPGARSAFLGGSAAKAACGAFEQVPLLAVSNLSDGLEKLRRKGFVIVGLSEQGTFFPLKDLGGPVVLVVGGEGKGLRRLTTEKCDHLWRIPTAQSFGTLNASVAGAIGMFYASMCG